jgi:uncharacterized protein (TIGR02246 family)
MIHDHVLKFTLQKELGSMKKLFNVCLLLIAMMFLAGSQVNGQQEQNNKAEQEVKKVERQWLDAYEQHDAGAMDRIVAGDWMITYPDGGTSTKGQIMSFIKSPRKAGMPSPKFFSEDVQARVYGDTVILTGRIVTQWPGGESNREQSRYTDTYVKRNGTWQVVASHMSSAGKPKKPE